MFNRSPPPRPPSPLKKALCQKLLYQTEDDMENYARSTTLLSAEAANTFRDVHDSVSG